MCFYFKQSKDATALKRRFKAKFSDDNIAPIGNYNGFSHPKASIITNEYPDEIQQYNWGLIPHWAKDESIKKYTLNARIETLKEKPSFRSNINKRCLVVANSFYEWKWLDPKGKEKEKYEIKLSNEELFTFAGLWSNWLNKDTGEMINSFTIITTEANELMSEIHNIKKRMPIIVDNEFDWLMGENLELKNDDLIAEKII